MKTLTTIKQYAQKEGVSYEAVRQQLKRYEVFLADHIIHEGRSVYLDEEAVAFLDQHRDMKRPVMLAGMDVPEIEAMAAELEEAKAQNKALQDKVILLYEKLTSDREKLLELQTSEAEAQKLLASSHAKELYAQTEMENAKYAMELAQEATRTAERERDAARREAKEATLALEELKRRKWWKFW